MTARAILPWASHPRSSRLLFRSRWRCDVATPLVDFILECVEHIEHALEANGACGRIRAFGPPFLLTDRRQRQKDSAVGEVRSADDVLNAVEERRARRL